MGNWFILQTSSCNKCLLLPFPDNFLDNIASLFYTAQPWGTSSQPEEKKAVSVRIHAGLRFAEHHGKSFANFNVFDYLCGLQSSGMLLFFPLVFCVSQQFTLYEMCMIAEESWSYFSEPLLSSLSLWLMLLSFWRTQQDFLSQPNAWLIKRSLLLIN